MPLCSSVVHLLPQSPLRSDTIPHSIQSSFLHTPFSPPSLLYVHFHHPSSNIVILSSHHIPLSWTFFKEISPTSIVVPLILSFLILSSFVTPHIHRSIHISVTSKLIYFSMSSSLPMSLPHTPHTSVMVLPLSCTPFR